MHHFSIWTFETCDLGVKPSRWWQESLPILALRHDFLLHAVLSFTSLHVAHTRLDDSVRYHGLAEVYRDRALVRLSGVVTKPLPDQVDACFWASVFVGLISLATYASDMQPDKRPGTFLVELASLWRGSGTVRELCATVAETNGPHASNATPVEAIVSPNEVDSDFEAGMRGLQICVERRIGSGDVGDGNKDIYVRASNELLEANRTWVACNSCTGILSWIHCVDPKLLTQMKSTQMKSGEPAACLLTIFWGVMIAQLSSTWYVGDLGSRVVQDLTSSIPLIDKEIVELVNWARQKVCGSTKAVYDHQSV